MAVIAKKPCQARLQLLSFSELEVEMKDKKARGKKKVKKASADSTHAALAHLESRLDALSSRVENLQNQFEQTRRVPTSIDNIWSAVKLEVQEELRPNYFDVFVKVIKPRQVHEDSWLLECPDRFHRDWVADHYGELIKRAFSKVKGLPVTLNYVTG